VHYALEDFVSVKKSVNLKTWNYLFKESIPLQFPLGNLVIAASPAETPQAAMT